MTVADFDSLLLGALFGIVVSVSGPWVRRHWERFDQEQIRCRSDLIELQRTAEAARIAVRRARLREAVSAKASFTPADADELLERYAVVAEAVPFMNSAAGHVVSDQGRSE